MKYKSFTNSPILHLVATPIGNLEDISLRALRILKEVNKIYCEDTRTSSILLNHYDVKTPLESYHNFNEETKSEVIINYIKEGHDVALISDAGNPIISDPGFKLVSLAIKNGIPVTTIPGPSAFTSAFMTSNMSLPFLFYGFLKPKKIEREKELLELKYYKATLIFYEAPHRLKDTLESILAVLGDRDIYIARELTKKYEEHYYTKVSELLANFQEFRGELVLIVKGYLEEGYNIEERFKLIDEQIKLGLKTNEAIKEVSKMLNIDKKELYKEYVKYKEEG